MSDESLAMPEHKKGASGKKVAPVLVLVVLAALGVWLLLSGGKTDPAGSGVDTTPTTASGSGSAPVVDPTGATLPVHNVGSSETAAGGEGSTGSNAATVAPLTDDPANIVQPPAELPAGAVELSATGEAGGSESSDNSAVSESDGSATGESSTPQGAEGGNSPINSSASSTIEGGQTASAATGDFGSDSFVELTPEQRAMVPTVRGSLSDNPPPADISRREDTVVTWAFIDNLAKWMVTNYQPVADSEARAGKSGQVTASIAGANMRFGTTLTGLRHAQSDPVSGRAAVLGYAYTPGMIDALQRLYGEPLVQAMHQAALEKGPDNRGALTVQQEADMFAIYAELCRQLAASLRGVAALPNLAAQIRDVEVAGQGVVAASNAFADVLFAYETAKEEGDKVNEEKLRQTMMDSSRNSEVAMERRTQVRAALTNDIKRRAGGKTLSNDSLVFLAEWVNRRPADRAAATSMAAEVATRMAEQFAGQSTRLRAMVD